ncbi:chromosomal replication initiator protein DnaA, partial [Pelagibacterales bacterium SAG-MED30]|nr:chromosomal replication initiator protein DnaA [Pelagibacterales bacterium SAG-MED30]
MNNTFTNKNLDNLNTQVLDWKTIQTQMKNKLGSEIYESWLKKINFLEEFNNYILLSVPTRFIR